MGLHVQNKNRFSNNHFNRVFNTSKVNSNETLDINILELFKLIFVNNFGVT